MQFVVTGFGAFAGVATNPTEALIDMLEDFIADGGQDPAYQVMGTKVLECAGQKVQEWLHDLYHSDPDSGLGAAAAVGTPLVVLHLGVDTAGQHFKLEQQAANEASFRVPDQQGWQPCQQLIDDHPGVTLATRLLTDLDLADLAERLEGQRHDVRLSLDAGRYVCNFTFYLSLLHSQKQRQRQGRPVHALFVHVPPVSRIPLERQFQFLLDLLQAIAAQLAPPAAVDSRGDGSSRASAGTQVAAAVQPFAEAAPSDSSNGAAATRQEEGPAAAASQTIAGA